ncbi:hypothetical protein GCG54_00015333 [Colletotrichum gloeosporioides]|uniref:Uncharacterized protein n=1 Tax=Colletotrichum gloeosporioides TaxID=474922 RepID=A0A8H4C8F3_COLGL|nr:uncharacterized protein GCG54_00015333 [Colletotrichum gloeosporioides]KAF3799147.1 hypothetical protein GCG54_00015333 [Colletotrichum gloeosporioides]
MRRLNGFNVAVWLCFLLLFLFYVTSGWDTAQHCFLLNVTTLANQLSWATFRPGQDGSQRNLYGHLWGYVKRARIALKDQSQQWLTIPVEISDPLKSIATKAGAHVATGKAISTGTVGLMDSLNGWRDAVPVYVCLQTRGVWQLGYLNDTVELVPQGELNMSHTLQITALENLWQAARLVVPGLPENVALEMDSSDLGAHRPILALVSATVGGKSLSIWHWASSSPPHKNIPFA